VVKGSFDTYSHILASLMRTDSSNIRSLPHTNRSNHFAIRIRDYKAEGHTRIHLMAETFGDSRLWQSQ